MKTPLLFLTVLLTIGTLAFGQPAAPDITTPATASATPTKPLIDWGSIGKASSIVAAPYLTYAMNNAANVKWGGGLFLGYEVANVVGVQSALCVSADWLGQFSLASGGLSLKYKTKPLGFLGFPDVEVTPFVIGALGSPYGGAGTANGDLAIIYDAGAAIGFGKFLGGKFTAGACFGEWQNAGIYSGKRLHFFTGWAKGF